MAKARKAGRPRVKDPLDRRHLVRMTKQDEADCLSDCERLSKITGTEWTLCEYLRMCARQMKGKHLA